MTRVPLFDLSSSGVPRKAEMSPLNLQANCFWERVREEPLPGAPAFNCRSHLLPSYAGPGLIRPSTMGKGWALPFRHPTRCLSPAKFASSVNLPNLPSNVHGEFQPLPSERRSDGVSGAKQTTLRYHLLLGRMPFYSQTSVYFVTGFCVNGYICVTRPQEELDRVGKWEEG